MATELVSSDYRIYWLASDCETVIAGITDEGVLETLGGFNIDVDFSTGKPITVDVDAPLASDTYVYGIDVDLQQTAEYTGGSNIESGGLIGIRSDVHMDYQITDMYAMYANVYIDPAVSESVNDALGVFSNVTIKGPITRALSTSHIAALRGNISNGSTGSYDGQVYVLSLTYGSNVNYDDNTALIYGYTHGDARCDYGLDINNYSPYMVAGILLEDTAGAVPLMGTGLHISANCTVDIQLQNGATIVNGAAGTLTITEDTIDLVGATVVDGLTASDCITTSMAIATDVTAIANYVSLTVSDAHGGAAPTYAIGVYSKIIAADYAGTDVYMAGVVGLYSITGTNASIYPVGAVFGWIADNTTTADGAFVALLDGDTQIVRAGAAFTVRSLNSTPGSYFDYGLDLYSGTIGAYDAVTFNTAEIRLSSGAYIQTGSADPNGSVTAVDGSIYLRTGTATANSILYVCKGGTGWEALGTT